MRSGAPITAALLLVMLAAAGCSDRAGSGEVSGSYAVAGGRRTLHVERGSGEYTTVGPTRVDALPVVVTRDTITIGGLDGPYYSTGDVVVGGGYVAFRKEYLTTDPSLLAGTYRSLIGAAMLGEIVIASDGSYVWCRTSTRAETGCAEGAAPLRGSVLVQPDGGLTLSGFPGTYAAYRRGDAVAIFPIDTLSPRLLALTASSDAPSGSFYQVTRQGGADGARVVLELDDGRAQIGGLPGWSGSHSYEAENGTLGIASTRCPGGTCRGIYNDALGIVYVAGIGNTTFVR